MTQSSWNWLLLALAVGGIYLVLVYLTYVFFLMASHLWIKKNKSKLTVPPPEVKNYPEITLLIPACNEEAIIEKSILSTLELDYPQLKILVINDGSKDQTLEVLIKKFELEPYSLKLRTRASPAQARATYRSARYPQLYVLDKSNTGKADSLNCALQYVDSRLFALGDADSILDKNALKILLQPFLEKTEQPTIAVGGTIRVMNEWRGFARFQKLEYLRAFFCGRVFWNYWGNIYMISGAVGLYDTEAALLAAGIPVTSRTEDLDFSFRLHVYHRKHRKAYRMIFLPNPVCSTWVPDDLKILFEQRFRWHRGLFETLWSHKKIFMKKDYGVFGSLVYFYLMMVELLSSPIEWLMMILAVLAYGLNVLDYHSIIIWITVSMLGGIGLNTYLLWIVRSYFPQEMPKGNFMKYWITGVIENFGYHQLVSFMRVISLNPFSKTEDESWRNEYFHPRTLKLVIPFLFFFATTTNAQISTPTPTPSSAAIVPAPSVASTPIPVSATDEADVLPKFQGSAGYALTTIENYHASHQGWVGLTSTKNEFSEPGVRLDYLDEYDLNEFKIAASQLFRNFKKQSIRGEISYSPEGRIYPQWSVELTGSAPVYGKPIEMVLGVRYSSYHDSNATMIFPGFDSYFLKGWVFSGRVYASKIKASEVEDSKWLLGYLLRLARYYSDENYYAAFFSSNQETDYDPIQSDYLLIPVTTAGVTLLNWFNDRFGLQPTLQWQQRGVGPFRNWFTISLGAVFTL